MFVKRWASLDDIPMYDWIKAAAGDLSHLRRKKYRCPIVQQDVDQWHNLHDQYLEAFEKKGKDELRRLLEKKAKLQADYIADSIKNRFNATKISITNKRIEELQKQMSTGITVEQANVYIGKWLGSIISLKKISAKEFYTMRDEYIKHVESQKQSQNGRG